MVDKIKKILKNILEQIKKIHWSKPKELLDDSKNVLLVVAMFAFIFWLVQSAIALIR